MHFNYRPDAAALTLSRRPGIVKFLNYRYSSQGCGALNPKDSLHFELLAMLNTKAIPVRSSSNNKKAYPLEISLANLDRQELISRFDFASCKKIIKLVTLQIIKENYTLTAIFSVFFWR